MKPFSTLLAASVLAISAAAASAATIDLTSGYGGDASGHNQNTGSFSSGGITGDILAGCGYTGGDTDCDLSSRADTPWIRITHNGVGVWTDNDSSDNEIDASNNREFLTFAFDFAVNLLNIDFRGIGSGDRYDLVINDVLFASNRSTDPWTQLIENVTSMTVVARSGDFTVRSFEAERAVAPIPLPATGLLLLGALGGLAAVRRRKA